jgi:predicted dienelactone hydrolase
LTQSVPVQLIWGSQDSVIPVSHARMAHSAMPGSLLEVFDGSGHFPFHDDPDRFVEIVERFIDSTEPAVYDQDYLRGLLRAGISEGAMSGSIDTRAAVLDAMGSDERSAT